MTIRSWNTVAPPCAAACARERRHVTHPAAQASVRATSTVSCPGDERSEATRATSSRRLRTPTFSKIALRWGSFGFFGPLTVRPDLWDRGMGSALLEPIVGLFDGWGVQQAGLFTFPQSPRHIGLYQKFGFWPQHLTPLLERQVALGDAGGSSATYAGLGDRQRDEALDACRSLTGAIFEGLDLEHEIGATHAQAIGDTVLLDGDTELDGFAVCHLGAGEAGSGTCFVKFAAARPGREAGVRFERLLDACEDLARSRGLGRIVAGINAARHDAYRRLLGRGYRTWLEGVVMQRPNEAGYCRPDVYLIDDLR